MSGWGTGGWGGDPWGGVGGSLSISSAFATSERTVQVTVSVDALVLTPLTAGDALNPTTWTVVTLDGVTDVRTFIVLAVRVVSPNKVFELYTLEKFDNYLVTHQVRSTTLLSAARLLIGPPTSANFAGVVASRVGAAAVPRLRDLENLSQSPDTLSGVLLTTAAGDYRTEEGAALLKKLIIRRLTTRPGEFFHLDPTNYGIGLRVKERLTISDLPRLKAEVERQVAREPEVDRAQASVSLDRRGILTIALRVRLRASNQEVPVQFQIPTSSVNL